MLCQPLLNVRNAPEKPFGARQPADRGKGLRITCCITPDAGDRFLQVFRKLFDCEQCLHRLTLATAMALLRSRLQWLADAVRFAQCEIRLPVGSSRVFYWSGSAPPDGPPPPRSGAVSGLLSRAFMRKAVREGLMCRHKSGTPRLQKPAKHR